MELNLLLLWQKCYHDVIDSKALILGRYFKLFSLGDVAAIRNINSAIEDTLRL